MAFIGGINTASPANSDPVGDGADEIRVLKSDVKTSFPNITGAVDCVQGELNLLLGAVTNGLEVADITKLAAITAAAADINIILGLAAEGVTAAELGRVAGLTEDIATTFTTNTANLALKAPLASPTLTGTVTIPTAGTGDKEAVSRDSYPSNTVAGVAKFHLDGTTLYISLDGTDANA